MWFGGEVLLYRGVFVFDFVENLEMEGREKMVVYDFFSLFFLL